LLNSDRRRLEVEGFRLRERLLFLSELGGVVTFGIVGRVVVEVSGEGWRHGGLLEPWRIGRRLTSQLSEVEIGACSVAEIH
jgi:hypothetical protein